MGNYTRLSTLRKVKQGCLQAHGTFYDYSKVLLQTIKDKITIICPIHGEFEQIAADHIRGCGCPKCARKRIVDVHKYSTKEFIQRAQIVHGTLYTYDNTNYVASKTKVLVTCKQHGDWSIRPKNHLQGDGCPVCGVNTRTTKITLSQDEAIQKVKEKSPTKWDFSAFKYTSSHKAVTVICPIHGEHTVVVNNLFNGRGCPKCQTSGFNPEKPAILYYLSVNNGQAYKIGITNRSVKERFLPDDLKKIRVVFELPFTSGASCYKVEQALLQMFISKKYAGPPLLSSGNTELFRENIFL